MHDAVETFISLGYVHGTHEPILIVSTYGLRERTFFRLDGIMQGDDVS